MSKGGAMAAATIGSPRWVPLVSPDFKIGHGFLDSYVFEFSEFTNVAFPSFNLQTSIVELSIVRIVCFRNFIVVLFLISDLRMSSFRIPMFKCSSDITSSCSKFWILNVGVLDLLFPTLRHRNVEFGMFGSATI